MNRYYIHIKPHYIYIYIFILYTWILYMNTIYNTYTGILFSNKKEGNLIICVKNGP